jgi:toxin-antitoxin system PIN domain toxin
VTDYFCDTSVWLPLVLRAHKHHAIVRTWLDGIEEGANLVFCRPTQQSFLRLLGTGSILRPYGLEPMGNQAAWAVYEGLVADSRVVYRADEPRGLESRWRDFALRPIASPNLSMDAYLAAFAQGAGYRMVTMDRAFRQFSGLDLLLLEV